MKDEKFVQIIILGITGDLAGLKLIPSLYQLYDKGLLPDNHRIVGVSRSEMDTNSLIDSFSKKYQESNNIQIEDGEKWSDFTNNFLYISGDLNEPETFSKLKTELDDWDNENNVCSEKIIYFATPPTLYSEVIEGIKGSDLHSDCKENFVRVVIEKPFGRDYNSAKTLNDSLTELFSESQIFRIDHVLGKDPLVDIISFRQHNPLISALFNSQEIDHIQLSYLEDKGVEDRLEFYNKNGVLRDMVQNHLLQILSLMTMEIPEHEKHESLSKAKCKIIRNLDPVKKEDFVIGQYGSGDNKDSYIDELGRESNTPTFTAIKTYINKEDKKIPVYMRTGKRLKDKYTEISLVFKDIDDGLQPNILSFRIQPDSGIYLVLEKRNVKMPEKRENIVLDYCYRDNIEGELSDAYENLLMQVIKGDRTYFIDINEVLDGWAFVDPLNTWIENNEVDLSIYTSGSWGPDESKDLIHRDGKKWYTEEFEQVCRLH